MLFLRQKLHLKPLKQYVFYPFFICSDYLRSSPIISDHLRSSSIISDLILHLPTFNSINLFQRSRSTVLCGRPFKGRKKSARCAFCHDITFGSDDKIGNLGKRGTPPLHSPKTSQALPQISKSGVD